MRPENVEGLYRAGAGLLPVEAPEVGLPFGQVEPADLLQADPFEGHFGDQQGLHRFIDQFGHVQGRYGSQFGELAAHFGERLGQSFCFRVVGGMSLKPHLGHLLAVTLPIRDRVSIVVFLQEISQ
jgi:hypothetical protein